MSIKTFAVRFCCWKGDGDLKGVAIDVLMEEKRESQLKIENSFKERGATGPVDIRKLWILQNFA